MGDLDKDACTLKSIQFPTSGVLQCEWHSSRIAEYCPGILLHLQCGLVVLHLTQLFCKHQTWQDLIYVIKLQLFCTSMQKRFGDIIQLLLFTQRCALVAVMKNYDMTGSAMHNVIAAILMQ